MLPSTQCVADRQVARSERDRTGQNRDRASHPIIGSSPALLTALERARQAARSGADVLLEAESGTGKELLARFVHDESARAGHPFVAISCAAVPESLLESELFGYVRGAFTGALGSNPGKFGMASGGTLLLDEIAEMPLALQPKLLRVLQEREFYRLGDSRSVTVDVRVIASTNRHLHSLVREGRFREDLYYRLNVIPLTLPPLRERGEDVIELAEFFVAKFASPAAPPRISEAFRSALRSHYWPGNVRELANTIRRAVALCDGDEIGSGTLPVGAAVPPPGDLCWLRPGLSLRELEKTLLEITLHATAGNRTHAAELLGVSLRTVRNKIREHGLPPRRLS
ncbi:MAG TPA: sigma 54-interacting transcriptional regulator [Candidatus Binatia bacterium]|nr:sigma 54-interacting transcriptional regulator [Candidatus Binatia bacterium]